ncbi:MAG: hypothetical protein K8S25_10530 [Alphaproteobacteria bacterium]|nr:hypothetical protein [Alphaproteobacteria bacterium]
MRFGMILSGLLVLSVLGLISALHGPIADQGFWLRPGSLVVGSLVFIACLTGMMVAHLHVSSEQAERAAKELTKANVDLELLVGERTQCLSEKVVELEQARAEAVDANAAKSRFLATMSHELRTPLNAILGFSELIEREMYGPAGDPRYVDYAQHIHQSGSHLLSLIGDILDLSKVEAGKMELYCEAIDVREIIEEAQRLAGKRVDAGHQLTVLIEDGLPRLNADRRALLQMLLNLLSNAMKFTPRTGAIAVTAGLRLDGGVTLTVRDTGVGIAAADIPRALAVYSQVVDPAVRKREGTGLGLPIVNALVKLHGGSLQLESEVGIGTTISLRFPFERSLGCDRSSLAA